MLRSRMSPDQVASMHVSMARSLLAPLLLVLLVPACQPQPDDLLRVSGRALDARGGPLADTEVVMWRGEPTCPYGQLLDDEVPLSPQGPTPGVPDSRFERLLSVRTDAAGAWSFEHFAIQAQSQAEWGSSPTCFRVDVQGEEGALARLGYVHDLEDFRFPALPLWDTPPLLEAGPGGSQVLSLRVSPVEGALSPRPVAELREASGGVVWRAFPPDRGSIQVDPALLEDFTGVRATARFEARVEVPGARSFGRSLFYGVLLRSPAVALASGTRIPVSRGAVCVLSGVPQADCPLTDGRLESVVFVPDFSEGSGGRWPMLEVRLAAPRLLRRLVARELLSGSNVPLLVEGSSDAGATWVKLGELPPDRLGWPGSADAGVDVESHLSFHDVPLTGAVAVDRVRLRVPEDSSNGGGAMRVRELSFFE